MDVKKQIHKYLKQFRVPAIVMAFAGLSVFGGLLRKDKPEANHAPVAEKLAGDSLSKEAQKAVKSPVLEIEYHTDTLEKAGSTLMMYLNGKIKRYYVENNNAFRMQMPYFAHEEWHHHNDETGYRHKYYYTPLEYYKLCMHDEISANMAALLTARYEYLAAPNKTEKQKIINRYKNTYLKFYFEAVSNGSIKPGSIKSSDIEKERRFIANGTRDMWMQKFSRHYSPTTYRMLQRYVGRLGLVADSKKSYKHILNQMYTIGGVNFAEYFDEDIYPRDNKVKLAEELRKIKCMRAGGLEFMDMVSGYYELMSQVSLDRTTDAFQNLLISSQLKYMLRNKTPEELEQNPQLVNLSFRKILNDVHHDKSFQDVVWNYPLVAEDRFNLQAKEIDYNTVIQKMYTYKGIDLTAMIPDFKYMALPIRSKFDNFFFGNFNAFYMSPMALEYLDKAVRTKSASAPKFPFTLTPVRPDTAKANSAERSSTPKPRMSAPQYLRIPNLREPLLVAAQKEDYEQIFACIREFESYPQVLKECNTQAQEKFLRQHEEQRDSLLRFVPKTKKKFDPIVIGRQKQKSRRR